MTTPPGDSVRVMVTVSVEPAVAWDVFTGELDAWWRHGPAYRMAGRGMGRLTLEAAPGGRLFEMQDATATAPATVREIGRVTVWEPPARLVLDWRAAAFVDDETTEVEVRFEKIATGTRVTLEHRGWSRLRADHPVRHGQAVDAFVRGLGAWWGRLLSGLREQVVER